MSILDAIFRRLKPEQVQTVTTLDEMPRPAKTSQLGNYFSGNSERTAVIRKCREMYSNDPRAQKMVRTLAMDMVRGGFSVQTNDQQALDEAVALQQRLNMDMTLGDWTKLTIVDGDTFLELGIDAEMNITDVTRKPTLEMHRNTDDKDRFVDPVHAFWWSDEILGSQGTPTIEDKSVIWFAQWQILHARWNHDMNRRYGSPMMASGSSHFKKVQEGELDVAIRRKTRSGLKYVHVIEGGDDADIEAYKEQNQDALDNPFAAVADFFTNKPGSLSVVQGDGNLGELGDVEHMIETWMMSGDIPMELLGYGSNLNRDVLGEKKDEYDEVLDQLREWVSNQFIKPLLELQWLLKGLYPKGIKYSIEWREKENVTPAMIRDAADAATRLAALGVSQMVIARILVKWLPGVKAEELFEDNLAGEAARLAGMADALAQVPGGAG